MELPAPDFSTLDEATLARLARAGEAMFRAEKQLTKAGHTVVSRVTGREGPVPLWDHFPEEDVYDHDTASQYYFHVHDKPVCEGEVGHFHFFLREPAFPLDVVPARATEDPSGHIAHLVAMSVDRQSHPLQLFVTNAWVTAESVYPGEALIPRIHRWGVDHTQPCLGANLWLSAAVAFFQPQITALIRARDEILAARAAESSWEEVFEDRELEVIACIKVSPEAQMRAIRNHML